MGDVSEHTGLQKLTRRAARGGSEQRGGACAGPGGLPPGAAASEHLTHGINYREMGQAFG